MKEGLRKYRCNNCLMKKSKKQYAYEQILEAIHNGAYSAGSRLIIDRLSEELDVSAAPIREALRQLEAEGFIEFKTYSGAVVKLTQMDEYIDLVHVEGILEAYIVGRCAGRITREDIDRLEEANRQIKMAMDGFELEKISGLNRQFHAVFLDYCENEYLKSELLKTRQKIDLMRRSVFTIVPRRVPQSYKEHLEIINLLKNDSTAEELEAKARQHRINLLKALNNKIGL